VGVEPSIHAGLLAFKRLVAAAQQGGGPLDNNTVNAAVGRVEYIVRQMDPGPRGADGRLLLGIQRDASEVLFVLRAAITQYYPAVAGHLNRAIAAPLYLLHAHPDYAAHAQGCPYHRQPLLHPTSSSFTYFIGGDALTRVANGANVWPRDAVFNSFLGPRFAPQGNVWQIACGTAVPDGAISLADLLTQQGAGVVTSAAACTSCGRGTSYKYVESFDSRSGGPAELEVVVQRPPAMASLAVCVPQRLRLTFGVGGTSQDTYRLVAVGVRGGDKDGYMGHWACGVSRGQGEAWFGCSDAFVSKETRAASWLGIAAVTKGVHLVMYVREPRR
jgi:hypothetical protein